MTHKMCITYTNISHKSLHVKKILINDTCKIAKNA